ncbi:MAG: hypothetical protein M9896_17760 [Candidatus Promineofilum sp.]|uniref:hypothetical protein n=1 Tax=Promineifilum sp. TaxID=2664178 RepID=UPI002412060D|nr:hypothetical protein [Promineifilum sp.]
MILDDGQADPKPTTFRIGLQDELYRIYAEHMGLFAEPTSRKTQPIRDMLRADENRYETNRIGKWRNVISFTRSWNSLPTTTIKRAYSAT